MRGAALAAAAALGLSGCVSVDDHRQSAPPAAPVTSGGGVPKTYQWLGSAEAAALSRESYGGLMRYALAAAAQRKQGKPIQTAVLSGDTRLEEPRWSECGAKPLAVILDIDETSILNTGANYDAARRGDPPYDQKRWDAWEAVSPAFVDPVPGSVEALGAIRAAGVTPIFISNRSTPFAAQAEQALDNAGLGPARQGETMFLKEPGAGSGKDPRRSAVAAKWCVVAMAGDQLGDFSDLFNGKGLDPQARRSLAALPGVASRWGQGWFLMPNPAYGPGDAGTLEQVFPVHRWPGPHGEETK